MLAAPSAAPAPAPAVLVEDDHHHQDESDSDSEHEEEEEERESRFAQIGARVELEDDEDEDDHDEDEDSDDDDDEDEVDDTGSAGPAPSPSDSPCVLGPYDEGRMELTPEERQHALAIQQAIESTPDLDRCSDFFYAQLALICGANVPDALHRAQQLQYLREEYEIRNDYEFGRQCIHKFMTLFPDYYLCYSFNHRDGNYVLVVDITKLPISTFRQQADALPIKIREIFFVMQLMSPDLEAIRRGIICMAECEGYQLSSDVGVSIWRSIWDMVVPYPIRLQKIKHFHTGVLANVLVSMVRQLLPWRIKERFEIGCLCEAGRLDKVYLTPDKQAARERILQRFEDALKRRYDNEALFQL